jgi:hypothetical protein
VTRLDIVLLNVAQEVEEIKIKSLLFLLLQQHLPKELPIQKEMGILLVKEEVEIISNSQEHVPIVRRLVTKNLSALVRFDTNMMLPMQLLQVFHLHHL